MSNTAVSNRRHPGLTVVVAGLGVALSITCGSAGINRNPSSPATATQDRETVSGRFVVVFGDPPPESGQPARTNYTLTDQKGTLWTLTFDDKIYKPPGGVLTYNGKQVEVAGRRTGTNRLMVESIRVL